MSEEKKSIPPISLHAASYDLQEMIKLEKAGKIDDIRDGVADQSLLSDAQKITAPLGHAVMKIKGQDGVEYDAIGYDPSLGDDKKSDASGSAASDEGEKPEGKSAETQKSGKKTDDKSEAGK